MLPGSSSGSQFYLTQTRCSWFPVAHLAPSSRVALPRIARSRPSCGWLPRLVELHTRVPDYAFALVTHTFYALLARLPDPVARVALVTPTVDYLCPRVLRCVLRQTRSVALPRRDSSFTHTCPVPRLPSLPQLLPTLLRCLAAVRITDPVATPVLITPVPRYPLRSTVLPAARSTVPVFLCTCLHHPATCPGSAATCRLLLYRLPIAVPPALRACRPGCRSPVTPRSPTPVLPPVHLTAVAQLPRFFTFAVLTVLRFRLLYPVAAYLRSQVCLARVYTHVCLFIVTTRFYVTHTFTRLRFTLRWLVTHDVHRCGLHARLPRFTHVRLRLRFVCCLPSYCVYHVYTLILRLQFTLPF